MQDIAIMIFIGLFFVVNAIIKKTLEKKKQRQAENAQDKGAEPAGANNIDDGIRSFMEQIQQTKEDAEKQQERDARATHSGGDEQVDPGYGSQKRRKKRSRETKAVKEAQPDGNASGQKAEISQTPDAARAKVKDRHDKPGGRKDMKGRLQFHSNNLVNAVVWSQIFRPPVSLRDEGDASVKR
ncbi:MAG: hypothetical protein ACOCR1_02725 [Planctomycetota bacterium]